MSSQKFTIALSWIGWSIPLKMQKTEIPPLGAVSASEGWGLNGLPTRIVIIYPR